MFKRTYRRLSHGAKTATALSAGKSLEWISRLTRTGGDPCPAEKYVRWFDDLRAGDPAIASEMHALVNGEIREMSRTDMADEFAANETATDILRHATEAITNLLDGEVTPEDEAALLRLVSAGERALSQLRRAQSVQVEKPVRFVGGGVR